MKNRQINSINVIVMGDVSVETIENLPYIKEHVFNELVASVKDAIRLNKETAILFEINNSGYFLELEKENWIKPLEKSIGYFEKQEDFEKCALIRDLIKSTYEQRDRKDSTSGKQHIGRKNSTKKKKEINNNTAEQTKL